MNAAEDVAKVVAAYIDSFRMGDGAAVREIFVAEANLHANERGQFALLPRDAYADYLTKRGPLPEDLRALGGPLQIAVHGPDLATAVVEVWGKGRRYTDALSLLKIGGHWKIVAKTYTWAPTEPAKAN